MANPSVTYTFSNSTTADATQVNSNFTDIINALTDGTKDITIGTLSVAGTCNLLGAINLGNASGDAIAVIGTMAFTTTPQMDTIAEKTSAAGVTIDSVLLKDGTYDAPSQSSVEADGSTTDIDPVASIVWTNERLDRQSEFDGTTFTAAVAGDYQINAQIATQDYTPAAGDYIEIYIVKNLAGSSTTWSSRTYAWAAVAGIYLHARISQKVTLAASDTITIRGYATAAGASPMNGGAAKIWLSIHKVA